MKLSIFLSALAIVSGEIFAQVPSAFNYQAVARDSFGNVLANRNVSVQFTIEQGINPGIAQYTETQYATTNEFGLFTAQIGFGTPVYGTFSGINWATGNNYLVVNYDPDGGTNFHNIGATQLLSVPYALYAGKVMGDTSGGGGGGGGGSNGWSVTGNSQTVYGTDFIGTTDSVNLMFKVNDIKSGFIENSLGNTGLGYNVFTANSTGTDNTLMGLQAMYSNNSGSSNTGIGATALYSNTTGAYNTAVGAGALQGSINGSYNTAVGYSSYNEDASYNNSTCVGYSSAVDSSNEVRLGNPSVTSIGGQVGWTTYSDARIKDNITENVPGMDFLKKLRPVTYQYDISKEEKLLGKTNAIEWAGKHEIEGMTFTGFLAQDVDAAAREMNYNFSGVDKTGRIWGIRYADFVPTIVKGMQEQEAIIEKQQALIDNLQKQLDELKNKVDAGLASGK